MRINNTASYGPLTRRTVSLVHRRDGQLVQIGKDPVKSERTCRYYANLKRNSLSFEGGCQVREDPFVHISRSPCGWHIPNLASKVRRVCPLFGDGEQ